MSSSSADMYLSLLVNSKKIKNESDFKYVDGSFALQGNLNNAFQILQKNVSQSSIAQSNITAFTDYFESKMPLLMAEFEKVMIRKID